MPHMLFRTWRNLLLTALGMGMLAGAGQLGIAFGFGIVQLTGASVNQWPAQLVWVGWFAAHAAVAGTVVTARLARRYGVLASTGSLVAIAAAAALGATSVAPLCLRPAQAVERISVDPIWTLGICAILGALVGAGAAIAVLVKPPLGWNIAAVGGAVWLLALASVVPSLAAAEPLPAVRLGVLEPAGLDADAAQRQAILILPAVALLIGVATGGLARWRGHPPLVNGATGTVGALLVAFAYLTAGPGDAVDRYQITPYYGALIAVAAGLLGSAAAALIRWPRQPRTAEARIIEPADILRPLSAGPVVSQAMTPAAGDTTDEPELVDLAGTGPVAGATAAKPRTPAEPLGFGAPADHRDVTAAPADLDDTPQARDLAPSTAAHPPEGPGADGSGTAEADSTEPDGMPPDGVLAAPGTRQMYQPPKPDHRTGVRTTWPVVPARRVPSPTEPAAGAEATHPAGMEETPEPALRPRNRPPLPDLTQAANWDALATARRAGPSPTTAAPAAREFVAEAGRPSGRLGLFRRNKSRTDRDGAGTPAGGEPLPTQDEDFVDWVTGLGRPLSDNEAAQESDGRSLRSTSRHR